MELLQQLQTQNLQKQKVNMDVMFFVKEYQIYINIIYRFSTLKKSFFLFFKLTHQNYAL